MAEQRESSFQYFVVDTFTKSAFKGNPAVVCFLNEEFDQERLQAIAQEFNLAKICGHGTIASTHAILSKGAIRGNEIEFVTQVGVFLAKKITEFEIDSNGFESVNTLNQLSFPLYPTLTLKPSEMELVPYSLKGPSTFNIIKMEIENDLIVELMSSKHVTDYNPTMDEIKEWPGRSVAITGLAPPDSNLDFFTRLFSPNYRVDEASPIKGILRLQVEIEGQRVLISGEAVTVTEGVFYAQQ